MSRFRIVIADDDMQETELIQPLVARCPKAEIWQVDELAPDNPGYPKQTWLKENDWRPEFLLCCDVLVLDMNMPCAPEYKLQGGGKWRHGGEAFLERFYGEWPGQAILIWSQYEDNMAFAESLTRKTHFDNNHCGPYIAKFNKQSHEEVTRLIECIEAMYQDFLSCGSLTNWGQIEFASSHDLPVLIVGESGTGKERIAWSIHRRWRTEKMKRNAELHIPADPAVVNCAGLSEQLARSELFGCVKGSFTGADDHRVGKCLLACGVNFADLQSRKFSQGREADAALTVLTDYMDRLAELEGLSESEKAQRMPAALKYLLGNYSTFDKTIQRPSIFGVMEKVLRGVSARAGKVAIDEYAELLRQAVPGLIDNTKSSGLDLVLKTADDQPYGTLFLDEFGDLPGPVQALLLRYLQNFEVQPLGYPGFVRNARIRIIAATSDPSVARMVGESLGGRVREIRKDNLREDLVFRVKGQVIRVQPVDESNLEAELLREIDKHGIVWDTAKGGAVEYIVEELRKVLAEDKQAVARGETPPFAFGHRREIGRIVRLANAFVTGAASRGIKGLPEMVTSEVLAKLWRPSMVVETGRISLNHGSGTYPDPQSQKMESHFKCSLTKTIIELSTAKDAVQSLHERVQDKTKRTTAAALGGGQFAEAFLLTWFSAYYIEGGKNKWNHRAAILVFDYQPAGEDGDQADASVKRVARTLFKVTGRDAISVIVKEAVKWKEWFTHQPDAKWPFKHEDVPSLEDIS